MANGQVDSIAPSHFARNDTLWTKKRRSCGETGRQTGLSAAPRRPRAQAGISALEQLVSEDNWLF
jgi:hypothetical protein